MDLEIEFQRNSFQETMIGLEYSNDAGGSVDIFSRASVDTFKNNRWNEYGYLFTQIFEPNVLREVALLENVPFEELAKLDHCKTESLQWLANQVGSARDLTLKKQLNVASALINISRFCPATQLADLANERAASANERLEVAWLEFLISNRSDDGAKSPSAFRKMREAISHGNIAKSRVLDVCCQGVVWYIKRKEIPRQDYDWCLETGTRLTRSPDTIDLGALSSWYRGVAMVPAAKGNAVETRQYMALAEEAAQGSYAARSTAFDLNAIKTYYESAIKEHMYVTKDLERAEEAAAALITLDPVWAPSYGELAEAYRMFNQTEKAAKLYEKAARMGPPYVGHHLLAAARCRAQQADKAVALSHYTKLVKMMPGYMPLVKEASDFALQVPRELRPQLQDALRRTQKIS